MAPDIPHHLFVHWSHGVPEPVCLLQDRRLSDPHSHLLKRIHSGSCCVLSAVWAGTERLKPLPLLIATARLNRDDCDTAEPSLAPHRPCYGVASRPVAALTANSDLPRNGESH